MLVHVPLQQLGLPAFAQPQVPLVQQPPPEHWPAALQTPSVSQHSPAWLQGTQTPFCGVLQEGHVAQVPLAHVLPLLQVLPFGTHTPESQQSVREQQFPLQQGLPLLQRLPLAMHVPLLQHEVFEQQTPLQQVSPVLQQTPPQHEPEQQSPFWAQSLPVLLQQVLFWQV